MRAGLHLERAGGGGGFRIFSFFEEYGKVAEADERELDKSARNVERLRSPKSVGKRGRVDKHDSDRDERKGLNINEQGELQSAGMNRKRAQLDEGAAASQQREDDEEGKQEGLQPQEPAYQKPQGKSGCEERKKRHSGTHYRPFQREKGGDYGDERAEAYELEAGVPSVDGGGKVRVAVKVMIVYSHCPPPLPPLQPAQAAGGACST